MSISLRMTTKEDAQFLKSMYSLYLHDLSAYSEELRENEAGTYEFDSFPLFWEKEGVNPYFIYMGKEKAGFFLLLEPPFTKKVDYLINDFFLYNRFRGKGIATKAVQQLFEQKPGHYFVAELCKNKHAVRFWHNVYHTMGISYEEYEDIEGTDQIICQEFTVKAKEA